MSDEKTGPRERPILFSGAMVRAILAGTKTQTRRVARTRRIHATGGTLDETYMPMGRGRCIVLGKDGTWPVDALSLCPYGRPGDRLWVRETWYCDHMDCINKIPKDRSAHADDSPLLYRADGECCEQIPECDHSGGHGAQWRPSIHMPRWASRITLEITGVRVERLQAISEADAKAEGAQGDGEWLKNLSHRKGADAVRSVPTRLQSARGDFADVWARLHGAESWGKNPWVWVMTFKRLEVSRGQ